MDLSFAPWNWLLEWLPDVQGWEKEFPKVAEWDRKINERECVKKAKAIRAEKMKA